MATTRATAHSRATPCSPIRTTAQPRTKALSIWPGKNGKITASPDLFDHRVGRHKKNRRHGEAECLGGLHVDDQLEFHRRLNREIRRILALEDAIDICRR